MKLYSIAKKIDDNRFVYSRGDEPLFYYYRIENKLFRVAGCKNTEVKVELFDQMKYTTGIFFR